jgi:hypothetical protein
VTLGDANLNYSAGILGAKNFSVNTDATNTLLFPAAHEAFLQETNPSVVKILGVSENVASTPLAVIGYNVPLVWSFGDITYQYDTSISRTAAATLAVGNGTQGDFSGTIKAGPAILTAAAPTVAAAQIGYGSTTAAASNCNVASPTPAGCVVVNIAGTAHYIPYY